MKLSHLLALAAGVLLVACGGTTTDGTSANKADYDALDACGTSACGKGFAQWIEGETPFNIDGMECTVEAMRDRTPGVYRALLDHTFSNGGEHAENVLVVLASGEVALGVHRSLNYDETSEESWEPTRRCTLKPAAFFEECLAALATYGEPDGGDPFPYIYPAVNDQNLPWFESCEEQAPACE